jgi:signal transduction histidine kinase/CheY-like chemotaxis protein
MPTAMGSCLAAAGGRYYIQEVVSVTTRVLSETPPPSAPARSELPYRALVGRDGRILSWHPELESVWGRSAAQALGQQLAQLLLPLEPASFPELSALREGFAWRGTALLIASDTRRATTSRVELVTCPDSDCLELSLGEPQRRSEREPGTVAHSSDSQRLQAVLTQLPGFCYTVDREFIFTSSEGAGLAHLQLAPGEVVGRSLLDLWGTRDPAYEPLRCHLKALAGMSATYRDVCLGRSLEYRLRPLEDAAGNIAGVIGVGVDVTDQERAEQERAKLNTQLRHAQRMEVMGRLAGSVAHDFNNYLTCILGNLSLLEDYLPVAEEPREYFAEANAAVDSAAALTRQLLAFGRKQTVGAQAVDLSSSLERMGGMLERLLGDRIRLSSQCSSELWQVQVDPGQLEQVLMNLVVNARDAITSRGEVAISAHNVDTSSPESDAPDTLSSGHYVALSVRDSGRGLSDVVRARLFEPFFTTKDVGQGTGLGLATVQAIVEQSGGAIRVESELGVGTTFEIFLPRSRPPPPTPPSPPAPSHVHAEVLGGTETILLVESDPAALDLAHAALQRLGYNVLPCASPDEALRTFEVYRERVALLITELLLPRMTGQELASRVRALGPRVKVLFSAAQGEPCLAEAAGARGPDAYAHAAPLHFIAKPYRPGELGARVRALLDGSA